MPIKPEEEDIFKNIFSFCWLSQSKPRIIFNSAPLVLNLKRKKMVFAVFGDIFIHLSKYQTFYYLLQLYLEFEKVFELIWVFRLSIFEAYSIHLDC